jgi:hypothetical protein
VHDSVSARVGDSVSAGVSASVNIRVHHSMRDSVDASYSGGASDLTEWHQYQGGQFWAGGGYWWGPAAVSFAIDVLRLDIGGDQELRARAYSATMSSACWWWPHRDFVIVSERPTLIDKHANGALREARWEWVADNDEHCAWSVRP